MSILTRILLIGAFSSIITIPSLVAMNGVEEMPSDQTLGLPTEEMPTTEQTTMPMPDANAMPVSTPIEAQSQQIPQQPTAPVTAPASQTTVPAPQVAAPAQQTLATTAPTAVPTVNINEYKKELDLVNTHLESIKQNESSLKSILAQLDDKLEKAKSIALAARKKSMDILNQPTQAEAQKILDEINQSFQEISKIQQESQNDVTKNIKTSSEKIQASIKDVQNTIAQLQEKGIALKLAQEKAQPVPATSAVDKKQAFRSWFIAEKNDIGTDTDKTFIHYIFNRVADLISGGFRVIAASYHVVKDALFNAPQKPTQPAQQPTPAPQSPTQQAAPTQAPTATPQQTMPLAAAGTSPAAAAHTTESIKTILDKQEQIVADLYKTKQEYANNLQELSLNIQNIILTLASNQEIKSRIPLVDLAVIQPIEEPSWKKNVVQGFSTLLDGIVYVYTVITFYVKFVYKSYISPVLSKFKADVQQKITEQNAQKSQPLPKQLQQAIQTQPQTETMPLPTKMPAA